jgi:hypothetical protein
VNECGQFSGGRCRLPSPQSAVPQQLNGADFSAPIFAICPRSPFDPEMMPDLPDNRSNLNLLTPFLSPMGDTCPLLFTGCSTSLRSLLNRSAPLWCALTGGGAGARVVVAMMLLMSGGLLPAPPKSHPELPRRCCHQVASGGPRLIWRVGPASRRSKGLNDRRDAGPTNPPFHCGGPLGAIPFTLGASHSDLIPCV